MSKFKNNVHSIVVAAGMATSLLGGCGEMLNMFQNIDNDGIKPTTSLLARSLSYKTQQHCRKVIENGSNWVCDGEDAVSKNQSGFRQPEALTEVFLAEYGTSIGMIVGGALVSIFGLGLGVVLLKEEEEEEEN